MLKTWKRTSPFLKKTLPVRAKLKTDVWCLKDGCGCFPGGCGMSLWMKKGAGEDVIGARGQTGGKEVEPQGCV